MTTNVSPEARIRLDSLTGLRFAAAFIVFLSHAAGRTTGQLHEVASFLGDQGAAGVSFFFILSGFVLTWSHNGGDTSGAFYRRRLARIGPAYLVCLVAGTALTIVVSGDVLGSLVKAAPSLPALQAWVPDQRIYYAGNGVGWSLSCEVFFYALFPIIAVGMARRAGGRALAALAVAISVFTPAALHPETIADGLRYWAMYICPATRLAEFVIGIALAKLVQSGWRSPVSLHTACGIAVVAYLTAGILPLWAATSLVMLMPFSLLIVSAASADLKDTWGLRATWMIRLGEWSFGFYLTHQMVLRVAGLVLDRAGGGSQGAQLGGIAACLAVALVISAFLFTFVERPLERRFRSAPRRPEALAAEG